MDILLANQSTPTTTQQASMNVEYFSPTPLSVATPLVDAELLNTTSLLNEREQMRVEFFRTYDVMTGVRIAATLGGFFGLMVLLVVYKSKCKSKSLSDEHLNAAAAAAVEEEDNELAATLEAAAFLSMNPRVVRGARRSLGNMSAPALVLTRGARFSSIGGYTSLEPPACFYYQRGKSLPGSALRFARQESYCEEDEMDSPTAAPPDALGPGFYHHHLTVPSERRRLSSITCSSADTSYLERKGSACEMGLPPPPPFSVKDCERRRIAKAAMVQEPWDFYYPIDIQVIQPTPELSPCGSERTLYDDPIRTPSHVSPVESISSATIQRLAPLASISSLGPPLSEFPDAASRSVGSDSVFLADDLQVDTEDEVDGFATDSDEEKVTYHKYRRNSQLDQSESSLFVPVSKHFLQVPCMGYPKTSERARRRLSAPAAPRKPPANSAARDLNLPSCSHSCEALEIPVTTLQKSCQRPPCPLPVDSSSSSSSSDSVPVNDATPSPPREATPPPVEHECDHVTPEVDVQVPPGSDDSWSQETLF